MIYYPLSTLMLAGIRDILIISTPQRPAAVPAPARRRRAVRHLRFRYAVQPQPDGLPQAFIIGARLHRRRPCRADPRRQHLLRPRPAASCCARPPQRATRRDGVRLSGRAIPSATAWSSSTRTASAVVDRGEAEAAADRTGRSPGSISTTTTSSISPRALKPSRARRTRDHRRQPRLSRARQAARRAHGPRLRLARYRHARIALGGREFVAASSSARDLRSAAQRRWPCGSAI